MNTLLHLTSDDADDWRHAMRSAALLCQHDDLVHENVTLLPHRHAIGLVLPSSRFAGDIGELLEDGVTVRAGATCFDARGVAREALPGVEIVPSGVAAVVGLQAEGFNYVKIP